MTGILFFALAVAVQLFIIQVIESDIYLARAEAQYVQRNYHLYDRGEIFFQTKEGELVSAGTLQSGYLVAVNPKYIKDPDKTFDGLKAVIDIDKDRFSARLARGGTYQEIASGLNESEASAVRSLGLPGVSLYPERWRFYPGGTTAAHVLGFAGFQGDEHEGRYGLENVYEDVLDRPESGYRVNFFAKLFGNIARGSAEGKNDEGNIVTTIEPMVQSFLEYELQKVGKDWGARSIGGIIMDPTTGAIKAMALLPTFDPNDFASATSNSVFSNSLVEGVYEMGSVVKPLTIAAGLDAGVIRPTSTYYDSGRIVSDGYTISNFDGKGNGTVSMQDVLNKSINTGVVHIMQQMGSNVFADYMRSFGLGFKTGIDLPFESDNLLLNLESPRLIEYATASFGQGIAVTPIGLTRALAALGNGGFVVEPYVVERIERVNGEVIHTRERILEVNRVISAETSKEISRMLVNTVDEALLQGTVSLPRHSIAAKTGTAQIPRSGERGYRDDAFLHSFFGYFPAYDPEFIVFLYHIEPQGAQYASQTLTGSFMEIAKFLIQYYGINPDR